MDGARANGARRDHARRGCVGNRAHRVPPAHGADVLAERRRPRWHRGPAHEGDASGAHPAPVGAGGPVRGGAAPPSLVRCVVRAVRRSRARAALRGCRGGLCRVRARGRWLDRPRRVAGEGGNAGAGAGLDDRARAGVGPPISVRERPGARAERADVAATIEPPAPRRRRCSAASRASIEAPAFRPSVAPPSRWGRRSRSIDPGAGSRSRPRCVAPWQPAVSAGSALTGSSPSSRASPRCCARTGLPPGSCRRSGPRTGAASSRARDRSR